MAIHVLTGKPGEGKTYILTKKALEFLDEGREVWTNYFIKAKSQNLHFYTKLDELINIENGVILMDEGHIYFNSRNWENLDERFQYKLQQHRKDGLDIWATAQNIKRLDVVVRELVSNYYECKKVFALEIRNHLFGLFIKREFAVEDSERPDHVREQWSREFIWLDKKVCNSFDTLQKIPKPDVEADVIKKYKKCDHCGKLKVLE